MQRPTSELKRHANTRSVLKYDRISVMACLQEAGVPEGISVEWFLDRYAHRMEART